MKLEIDLMENYPQTKRDVSARGSSKTKEDRAIARRYGKEFFDGSRDHGYGGFSYNERFWTPVIPTFQNHWDLDSNSAVLDIGCAKGFMIYDMQRLIPGITIAGLDISEYAIDNSHESVKEFCQVGNAIDLPFDDNSFDVSISITTMHNLEGDELTKALQEIVRVSKKGSFITVDAYRDEAQKERMMAWNLTAKTVLHVDEWKEMFDDVGYTGDYHWFMP